MVYKRFAYLIIWVLIPQIFYNPLVNGSLRKSRNVHECKNMIPGILQMYRAVDVTKLDLFDGINDHGYRDPIFDTKCDPDVIIKYDGADIQKPLELMHVIENSKGNFGNTAVSQKTADDIKTAMSVTVGLDLAAGLFSFSASTTYKRDRQTIDESEKSLVVKDGSIYVYEAQFRDVNSQEVSKDFKKYFDSLPSTFEADPEAYFKFINQFGTHYFYKANFGGVFRMRVETLNNLHKKMNKDELLAKIEAKYKMITGNAEGSASRDQNSEDIDKNTSTKWFYFGGESFSDENNFSNWGPTVKKNPWLVGGKLRSITDASEKDDPTKSKELEKAIDVYIKRSYLRDEIDPRLVTIIATRGVGYPSAELYKKELEQLTSTKIKENLTVIKKNLTKFAGDMHTLFNPPEWWTEDIQLQLEWSECNEKDPKPCKYDMIISFI